jgi:hypothetical protein
MRAAIGFGGLALFALGAAGTCVGGTGMRATDPASLFLLLSLVGGFWVWDWARSAAAWPRLARGSPAWYSILPVLCGIVGLAALIPPIHDAALGGPPLLPFGYAFRLLFGVCLLFLAVMTFVVSLFMGAVAAHRVANAVGLTDARLREIGNWPENGDGSALTRYWRYLRMRMGRGRR